MINEENLENKEDLNMEMTLNEDMSSLANLDIDLDNIDVLNTEVENNLESNNIIKEVDKLALELSEEEIREFYDYLSGKIPRPMFADKFFADAESRIRESNQLTTMMGLSFVPKLLAVEQSLINDLCSEESLKYISSDEKLARLQTLASISTKFNELAMKYNKMSKDFSGLPSIYRQLLDKLMSVPADKINRLKSIPDLLDLPDNHWNRIIEIMNNK